MHARSVGKIPPQGIGEEIEATPYGNRLVFSLQKSQISDGVKLGEYVAC